MQGDAFFVAFPRAKDAIAASVAAQKAIAAHSWPGGNAVRVRMGLHTGEPINVDMGYVGLDVHRAARICGAGHGGQVLLSGTTRELVEHDLPEGASLRDLGFHRLKDLAHPQHLFQVVTPGLPTDSPPLKTLDTLPNNLPRQLTSFIGREREIAEIKRLLSTTCLLTLTGAGGSGKTRLALQVAADLLEQYPDGAWLVELAAQSDPALVPLAVASSLDVHEHPGRELTETLADYLRSKSLLLLLDNCEHLLVACAQLADGLLRVCPTLRLIATSREGLGIAGEILYPIPCLPVPDPQRLPPVEGLAQYEAVRLFAERAMAVVPTFKITPQNAQAVAQACHRLDGIPLAIELAAARVKALGVDQIVARLDDRFRLLTGGSRTAVPRHQTLRAAMDWSYALLSEQEQILLRRLSVFAGGWSLEAAEAICSNDGVEVSDVLDLLTRLVDRSLVLVETRGGEARYQLLETVRQYARDWLLESGEDAGIRVRHQDWFLALAERAEPELRGPRQMISLERLRVEHDNLRTALEWSKMDENSTRAGVRLVGALQWFWFMFMHNYVEGREWLQWALSRGAEVPAHTRAKVLTGAGMMAWVLHEHERARTLLRESLSLFRELGDKWAIAFALHHLAHVGEAQGDFGQGTTLFEESLAVFRETGDKWGLGLTLTCLGNAASLQGDYDRAAPLLEESLAFFREVGTKWHIESPMSGLALIEGARGNYRRATALLEASVALERETGDTGGLATSLSRFGRVMLWQGSHEHAKTLYKESLALNRTLGTQRPSIAVCLAGLAAVAVMRQQAERAARLFGAAKALREAIHAPLPPTYQAEYDRHMALLGARLEETALTAAWAEGRAMTIEEAIEYALEPEEGAPPTTTLTAQTAVDKEKKILTQREREVAALIAQGLTNREIASRLIVAERTAEGHVQSILNKLGVSSRAQIAAWAVARGLHTVS